MANSSRTLPGNEPAASAHIVDPAILPRIALLSNYPADHTSLTSGVESATVGLLEGLRAYQQNYEIHVVSTPPGLPSTRVERRDGFYFHFLAVPQVPWARPRLAYRIAAAYRELRRIRPQLIHCQDNMALAVASIFSRRPRVLTPHGFRSREARERTGWASWSARADSLLEPFVHRGFDARVAVSRYALSMLKGDAPAYCVHNAVRMLFFDTPRRPAAHPYLVFAGVLAPLKRPADLIEAHARLRAQFPDLATILCGPVEDATYASAMKRLIAERNIDGVTFAGLTDQQRLAELLSGAVALVLPSVQENAPMVIAEAMAMGVPVVATRVGGTSSLVRDGETGWLYECGAVDELTEALRRLLLDPALRDRFGRAGRCIAEHDYRPARVAQATLDVYSQVLSARTPTKRAHV